MPHAPRRHSSECPCCGQAVRHRGGRAPHFCAVCGASLTTAQQVAGPSPQVEAALSDYSSAAAAAGNGRGAFLLAMVGWVPAIGWLPALGAIAMIIRRTSRASEAHAADMTGLEALAIGIAGAALIGHAARCAGYW